MWQLHRIDPAIPLEEQFGAIRELRDVLSACEGEGIGFIPWAPIAMGDLLASSGVLATVAARHGATEAQIALAWLLQRSPVVLPIPGTGSLEHLRENLDAALIELPESDVLALERDAKQPSRPPV